MKNKNTIFFYYKKLNVGDAIVAVSGLSSNISSIKSCIDCADEIREIANNSLYIVTSIFKYSFL